MAFLMFQARLHDLLKQRSDIQYKLNKISTKLRHLQEYASIVGNGSISIGDLLRCPGTMTGRAIGYLSYANMAAIQYTQANAPMMTMMFQQQNAGYMQNPQQMQNMQAYIMNTLYAQGRELVKQQEEKNLKVEEGKIAQEKDILQTQLAEINEEIKACKDARNQGIKDLAPNYVGVSGQ